ncbi:MAG: alpha/beta fold hydrolase [Polyangiaceae bacterium]
MGTRAELIDIRNADGTCFQLRSFTCEGPRAAILVVPAMGVSAKFYDHLGAELAAAGLNAYVTELRGIGSSDQRASRSIDFGYREFLGDLEAAANAVNIRVSALPLFIMGHSLGGHLAILFAALHVEKIRGVAVVAGGTPHFRNWKFPMSAVTLLGSSVMRGLGLALGYVPGNRIGFGGREANRVVAEWAHFVRTGKLVVRGIDSAHLERARAAVTLPTLGVSLEEDDYAPRNSVDKLMAMLPNAKLTRVHLERGAVGAKMNHFRWAKQPRAVVAPIASWIAELK